MPLLFKAIAVFLAAIVSGVVARGLASLGMGLVIYNGVDVVMGAIQEAVKNKFGQIGADLLSIIGLFGIDVYVSLVLSAYAAVVASKLIGGAFVRLGFLTHLVNQVKGGGN